MQPVEASDYHEFSRLAHPAVAPGGDRVAFVQQTPDGDEEYDATVHVASVGGEGSRRFTVAEGVDSGPAWSPSGDRLAFVSTRGARGRQSRPRNDDRPQLWVLPVDGGEAEQVTDVVGGVSGVAWGPDGDRIAFLQSVRPEEREDDLDLEHDKEYEREAPDPRVVDRHVYRAHEQYRPQDRVEPQRLRMCSRRGRPECRVVLPRRDHRGDECDRERDRWRAESPLEGEVRDRRSDSHPADKHPRVDVRDGRHVLRADRVPDRGHEEGVETPERGRRHSRVAEMHTGQSISAHVRDARSYRQERSPPLGGQCSDWRTELG